MERKIYEFSVGDIIKSEDFEPIVGRKPCFMIGTIKRIDTELEMLVCQTHMVVWAGEVEVHQDSDYHFSTPINMGMFDWSSRITIL